MSKRDKLLERFKKTPRDFEWSELTTLLGQLGYADEQGDGSRICYIDGGNRKIFLHKPHPGNILKAYVMRQVLEALREHGKI